MGAIAPVIEQLKENGEDFEWYPTTDVILDVIKKDIVATRQETWREEYPSFSLMDIGAGDGRSLEYLKPHTKYAIEKSMIHISNLPADIFVVGTEFEQATLIDKKVDVIFCNPPYSQFGFWSEKIIKEANADTLYLVIPERWVDNHRITEALKYRDAEAKSLGEFHFLNAERKARAVVNVVRVQLSYDSKHRSRPKTDPFELWFRETFKFDARPVEASYGEEQIKAKNLSEKLDGQLTSGKGVIPALVELYQHEQQHLIENYMAVQKLDRSILEELGVNVAGLSAAFKQRISGLKKRYWQELFKHYKPITSRLASKTRKRMLDHLSGQVSVDFTESNALAVSAWAIKNANQYFDSQLVDVMKDMVDQANVVLYKSNERTFGKEDWRYRHETREKLSHYGLELRVVLERFRAIKDGGYDFEHPNNLHESAHDFINDVLIVAGNLGYRAYDDSHSRQWVSNKAQNFFDSEGTQLMSVKAFKNGNIHVKFNQGLIKKMNIEFGRLNGWLKDWSDAVREMDVTEAEAKAMFNTNYRALPEKTIKMLVSC